MSLIMSWLLRMFSASIAEAAENVPAPAFPDALHNLREVVDFKSAAGNSAPCE
jgi:hypothetical protein